MSDRPELLERVRAIGIDCVQGYLLHEPEPLENVFRSAESAAALSACRYPERPTTRGRTARAPLC